MYILFTINKKVISTKATYSISLIIVHYAMVESRICNKIINSFFYLY